MKVLKNVVLFLTFCLVSLTVQAVPITWVIDSMTFDDGGWASGSFVYDADINVYRGVNIVTTAGSSLSGDTYLFPNTFTGDQQPYFLQAHTVLIYDDDYTGIPFLTMQFGAALTDAGMTTSIVGVMEGICGEARCVTRADAPYRLPVSGSVSARSVPEPATLALMGLGLAGIGWKRRKAA